MSETAGVARAGIAMHDHLIVGTSRRTKLRTPKLHYLGRTDW